jgi:probable HAF family extracellular repeat protein
MVAGAFTNSAGSMFGFQFDETFQALPGGEENQARGVNQYGQVAGTTYSGGHAQATIWNGGVPAGIGTLGGADSYGTAINDTGQVTGSASSADGSGRAFLYTGGSLIELGGFAGSVWSSGYAINNAGVVAGYAMDGYGKSTGVVWAAGGAMTPIPSLGGAHSFAMGINKSGEVTGSASRSNGFLEAFLYSKGTVVGLGTLGGAASFGYGINDTAQVVGYSWMADGTSNAFLYINGMMLDLNLLAADLGGWHLEAAYAINGSGQITGSGWLQGEQRAFLLNPLHRDSAEEPASVRLSDVPEPGTAVIVVTGLLLVLIGIAGRSGRRDGEEG